MRVSESNLLVLNPNENETLVRMARDGSVVIEDMEEGEISDDSTSSVKEITAEDFRQESRVSKPKLESRVWIPTNYYNFAWAQAVQNKPLPEILVRNIGSEEKSNRSDNNKGLNAETKIPNVIIDDSSEETDSQNEKEEGELEEGEIELLETEKVEKSEEVRITDDSLALGESEKELKKRDFEKRVNPIREALKTVTVKDAEKSFNDVCSRLRNSIGSLQPIVLDNYAPVDDLVQQIFAGIKALYSAFSSASSIQKEQNQDVLSRLLDLVKNQDTALFPPEQMKEIDAMLLSVVSIIKAAEREKETCVCNGGNNWNNFDIVAENSAHGLISSEKYLVKPITVKMGGSNSGNIVLESTKPVLSFTTKGRVDFGPLLDLHADHDEGSLPSPTRENPPPLPTQKPVGNVALKSHSETSKRGETEDATLHPYETDAVQAVSSYQQKFARTSFLSSNRLPSPTPSEECDDGDGVGDSQGDVSSSPVVGGCRSVNSAVPCRPTFVSTSFPVDGSSGQLLVPSRTVGQLGPGSNPILKALRNSRDPRLRYANSDAGAFDLNQRPLTVDRNAPKNELVGGMNSRKRKIVEDSAVDAYTVKRQRNGLLDSVVSKDVQMVTGSVGRLEDSSIIGFKPSDKDLLTDNMENDIKNPENAEADFNNGGGYEDMEIDSDDNLPVTYSSSRQLPVTSVQIPVTSGQLPVTTSVSLPVTSGQFPITSVQLPDTSGHLPVTSAPLPVTSRHLPVTSVQVPVTSGHLPVTSSSAMLSLPSLLKDIAGNPAMLLHLLNMEQQRLAAEARQKSADPSTARPSNSSILPSTVSSGSVAPSKAFQIAQSSAGKLQTPIQTASTISQNEWGKVRMKPRDPRRILLNNTVQKSENLGSEQFRTNGGPSSNIQGSEVNLTVREQGEQADTTCLPSQSSPLPDIAGQFTKKLKNLAEMLSGSQGTSNTSTTVAQNISQPMMPIKTDKLEPRIVLPDSNAQHSISGLISEEGAASSSQSQNPWGDFEHLLERYDDQQKAAIQRERGRRIEEQNKMFASRKLCLVLDLDHTLLNSAKFIEVDPMHDEILRKKEEQDREKPLRHLFRFSHMGMWTKLRPGIWSFLEKASKLYELHLYTMGNKLYATEMAKVLDPTGALFAGRVISKGDDSDPFDGDERMPKNKDLDGVLGMESAVVIIDDSIRVWPHHKHNLIIVERYTYFPCSRRQFGLPGPSLLEIDHDERPEDGTLASSFAVIERIHQNFFSHRELNDVDVRSILASEQHKILNGCRIVFSRVFPVGEANPHLHPLWQMAQQFGAVCTNQIDDQVTHVVANSLGTDKVNWALSTGRFVVHPGWVEASALLYRRATEQDFAIKL